MSVSPVDNHLVCCKKEAKTKWLVGCVSLLTFVPPQLPDLKRPSYVRVSLATLLRNVSHMRQALADATVLPREIHMVLLRYTEGADALVDAHISNTGSLDGQNRQLPKRNQLSQAILQFHVKRMLDK